MAKMEFRLRRIVGRIIGEAALLPGEAALLPANLRGHECHLVKEEKGNEWVNPC
jgi:hypothetical protein